MVDAPPRDPRQPIFNQIGQALADTSYGMLKLHSNCTCAGCRLTVFWIAILCTLDGQPLPDSVENIDELARRVYTLRSEVGKQARYDAASRAALKGHPVPRQSKPS